MCLHKMLVERRWQEMLEKLRNLVGERLEVNNSVGAPAVVGVQDEIAVEVTSIQS